MVIKWSFFHEIKPEIFYFSSASERNNSSRVLSSEKNTFHHLIRNFIFWTLLFFFSTIKITKIGRILSCLQFYDFLCLQYFFRNIKTCYTSYRIWLTAQSTLKVVKIHKIKSRIVCWKWSNITIGSFIHARVFSLLGIQDISINTNALKGQFRSCQLKWSVTESGHA